MLIDGQLISITWEEAELIGVNWSMWCEATRACTNPEDSAYDFYDGRQIKLTKSWAKHIGIKLGGQDG